MDIVKRREILHAFKHLPAADLSPLVRRTRIDPLPAVVPSADAPLLRRAMGQWGRLLTAVYLDLWGDQTLVRRGLISAQHLWGDLGFEPGFSRALPAGVAPLSLIRLDAVRGLGGAGRWTLRSLGTGVPRGLGLSLETRITHSRTFGRQVPHDNLLRLAPFFLALKDLWYRSSLTHRDEPAIMVWTSGPSDPSYFEPVSLARYFGYPLVESRDLTVRSGRVFLKTLGGLRPVDVLVRLVPDRSFDPLTGNPGGWGGVAGLTQAVRDGTVLVTNAPGAGLLEQPGLLPLYPALCRDLLGEDLLLPPGEPPEADRDDFWREGRWQAGAYTVRLFGAPVGSGWDLMPGGVAEGEGGESPKDLWFLTGEAVAPVTLLPAADRPAEISRAADLPSRLADDLLWLGRYTERAWADLRTLETWAETRTEHPWLDPLVRGLGLLPEAASDEDWPRSRLAQTIADIRQITGQVLDRLSLETHRTLAEFPDLAGVPPPADTLRQLNLRLAAFSGLTMENMTRNAGWRFLDLGRRLERGQQVLEGLEAFFTSAEAGSHLGVLLDVFDSTLTYRTRYRLEPQRGAVLDLLLLDESNPRSLAFQVLQISEHIAQLPRPSQRAHASPEERTVLGLLTRLRLADGQALEGDLLPPFLRGLYDDLETLGDILHRSYLAKIEPMEALQARERGEEA